MQNAKDSVYTALRSRLAALNPSRTIVLRGAIRPAVVVAENELDGPGNNPPEAFVLLWKATAIDLTEPMPLHTMQCDVQYATRGTPELSGMDRGRVLAAMDGELTNMLQPAVTTKQDYTNDPASILQTAVSWSAPVFRAAELKDGTLTRTVTFSVFALGEAGE